MVLADSDRISHVPPYSGYCYLLNYFVYGAITLIAILSKMFHYNLLRILQSYNPKLAETNLVWAISTSLAATTEITIVFSSYAYLDVSVQRVSVFRQHVFNMLGFPIRKCPDQKIFASPRTLSQLITSFFAFESLGIPRVPLVTY